MLGRWATMGPLHMHDSGGRGGFWTLGVGDVFKSNSIVIFGWIFEEFWKTWFPGVVGEWGVKVKELRASWARATNGKGQKPWSTGKGNWISSDVLRTKGLVLNFSNRVGHFARDCQDDGGRGNGSFGFRRNGGGTRDKCYKCDRFGQWVKALRKMRLGS